MLRSDTSVVRMPRVSLAAPAYLAPASSQRHCRTPHNCSSGRHNAPPVYALQLPHTLASPSKATSIATAVATGRHEVTTRRKRPGVSCCASSQPQNRQAADFTEVPPAEDVHAAPPLDIDSATEDQLIVNAFWNAVGMTPNWVGKLSQRVSSAEHHSFCVLQLQLCTAPLQLRVADHGCLLSTAGLPLIDHIALVSCNGGPSEEARSNTRGSWH